MTQGWCQRGALLCNALQADPECVRPGPSYYSRENNALAVCDNAARRPSPFPQISMHEIKSTHLGPTLLVFFLSAADAFFL